MVRILEPPRNVSSSTISQFQHEIVAEWKDVEDQMHVKMGVHSLCVFGGTRVDLLTAGGDQHIATLSFESTVLDAAWSYKEDFLVVADGQGSVHIVYVKRQTVVVSHKLFPAEKDQIAHLVVVGSPTSSEQQLVLISCARQMFIFSHLRLDDLAKAMDTGNMELAQQVKGDIHVHQTSIAHQLDVVEDVCGVVQRDQRGEEGDVVVLGEGYSSIVLWKDHAAVRSAAPRDGHRRMMCSPVGDGVHLMIVDAMGAVELWDWRRLIALARFAWPICEQVCRMPQQQVAVIEDEESSHWFRVRQLFSWDVLFEQPLSTETIGLGSYRKEEEGNTVVMMLQHNKGEWGLHRYQDRGEQDQFTQTLVRGKLEDALEFARERGIDPEEAYRARASWMVQRATDQGLLAKHQEEAQDIVARECETLMEMLDSMKDQDWVARFCVEAAVPSALVTRALLEYAMHLKDEDAGVAWLRLSTFITWNDPLGIFDAVAWQEFRQLPLKQWMQRAVQSSDLGRGVALYRRHALGAFLEVVVANGLAELAGTAVELLQHVPLAVPVGVLVPWLRWEVVPLLDKKKLHQVQMWLEHRMIAMDQAQYALERMEEMVDVVPGVHRFAVILKDVRLLRREHEWNIPLEERLQLTPHQVAIQLLQRVIDSQVLVAVYTKHVVPYAQHHRVHTNDVLHQYMEDRLGHGEECEQRIVPLLPMLTDTALQAEILLEVLRTIGMPEQETTLSFVQSLCDQRKEEDDELLEQWRFLQLKSMMATYGMDQLDATSVPMARPLMCHIASQVDRPTALEDSLLFANAFTHLTAVDAYVAHGEALLDVDRADAWIACLRTAPLEIACMAGQELLSFLVDGAGNIEHVPRIADVLLERMQDLLSSSRWDAPIVWMNVTNIRSQAMIWQQLRDIFGLDVSWEEVSKPAQLFAEQVGVMMDKGQERLFHLARVLGISRVEAYTIMARVYARSGGLDHVRSLLYVLVDLSEHVDRVAEELALLLGAHLQAPWGPRIPQLVQEILSVAVTLCDASRLCRILRLYQSAVMVEHVVAVSDVAMEQVSYAKQGLVLDGAPTMVLVQEFLRDSLFHFEAEQEVHEEVIPSPGGTLAQHLAESGWHTLVLALVSSSGGQWDAQTKYESFVYALTEYSLFAREWDHDGLVGMLSSLPRKKAFQLLKCVFVGCLSITCRTALGRLGREYERGEQVARLGSDLALLWGERTFLQHCHTLERDAQYWQVLGNAGIPFSEERFQRSQDGAYQQSLLPALLQSVPLHVVSDYVQAYTIPSSVFIALVAERAFLEDASLLSTVQHDVAPLSMDERSSLLHPLIPRICAYDYDRLKIAFALLQDQHALAVLKLLGDYTRHGSPSSGEVRQWAHTEEQETWAQKRLPFHGLEWDVLDGELNESNFYRLLPLAKAVGFAGDDVCDRMVQSHPPLPWPTLLMFLGKMKDPERALQLASKMVHDIKDEVAQLEGLRLGSLFALRCKETHKGNDAVISLAQQWKEEEQERTTAWELDQCGCTELQSYVKSPAELICQLYQWKVVRDDEHDGELEGISVHQLVDKIAARYSLNAGKIRRYMVHRWLQQGKEQIQVHSNKNVFEQPVEEQILIEEAANTRRIVYVFQHDDHARGALYLMNYALDERSVKATLHSKVRAMDAAFALVPNATLEEVMKQSMDVLRAQRTAMKWAAEFRALGVSHGSDPQKLHHANWSALARSLWAARGAERQGVHVLCQLCWEYDIGEERLWEGMITALWEWKDVRWLLHVLIRLPRFPRLLQLPVVRRVWPLVIQAPLQALRPQPLQKEHHAVLQLVVSAISVCPDLSWLPMERIVQYLMDVDVVELALRVVLLETRPLRMVLLDKVIKRADPLRVLEYVQGALPRAQLDTVWSRVFERLVQEEQEEMLEGTRFVAALQRYKK